MKTQLFGWLGIAVLVAATLVNPALGDRAGLLSVISVTALLVAVLAGLAGMYVMAAVFLLFAVLYNPVLPLTLVTSQFVWMYLAALSVFGVWLALVKIRLRPRMAIPSITDRTPGSQSL